MKKHYYEFVSHWHVPAPIDVVQAAVIDHHVWQQWWQGLEKVVVLHEAEGDGAKFRCTWRSFSGYRITLNMTITKYDQGRDIAFTSQGDLEGSGDFAMHSSDGATTDIVINWNVETTKYWMNLFAPILRPVFAYNHDKLMADGERGLVKFVSIAHK